jgi:hypothetical protein
MDMCWHDTEVCQPETVFFLCVLQGDEHYFSAQLVFKDSDFIVSPAGNMIKRAFN